jgi:predicted glutamine amidotransferase
VGAPGVKSQHEYAFYDDAFYDGERTMRGGTSANSVVIASEPLTRDTSSWVEVSEYGMLVATMPAAARP